MSRALATTVDLIRHGEPVGGGRFRGHSDDPLSERGWAQMRDAVGAYRPWSAVVSSPLKRCHAFAEELSARHGLPLETDGRWKEIGFGGWEGRTAEELLATDAERLTRFWRDPIAHAPPGGEPFAAFHARVLSAWNDLLMRHAGRHVLLIGHAGVIRMIVRQVLDVPLDRLFRIEVPNAAVTRVRIDHTESGSVPVLVFHAARL